MNAPMTSESIFLTPQLATEFVENECFPDQRRISQNKLDRFAADIEADRFSPSVMEMACSPGERWLIDGQHRCRAVVMTGKPIWVTMVHLRCRNIEEAGHLYGDKDNVPPRSKKDVYIAEGIDKWFGKKKGKMRAVDGAVRMIVQGFAPFGPITIRASVILGSSRVRVILAQQWFPTGVEYLNAVWDAGDKILKDRLCKPPAIAIGMIAFRYRKAEAGEFWPAVAANDRLMRGTPEHALVKFLHENDITGNDYPIYARAVASAWNARFDRRTLHNVRKPADAKDPIKIAGTDYTGEFPIYDPVLQIK